MGDKQINPANTARKLKQLRVQIKSLRAQLDEAEESLAAIQSGDIDALVVHGPEGPRIFTLQGADHAYRELIEQMAEGAVTLKADGAIDYCNRGFADMLKQPLEQIIGTLTKLYVAEVDHPTFEAMLLQGIKGSVRGELGFLTADGRVVPTQVGLSPLVDAGRTASVSMVVINLTTERAKTVAESASKAKDNFLAVLSHELRTPLVPVLAAVSMLQNDPRFEGDARDNLDMISRNAELEARLIDDLLDVTRIERGKVELDKEPVELRTVMQHAAEVCMPDIKARKLKFGIEAPGGSYLVNGDPARLQQVFWNLLKNAIKFTPAGGCVGIRCHRDGQGAVVAEVNDSGQGIEAEMIPRLFKAFEQGGRQITRQFGGLGLGLAISKAMVELHGGSIKVHSEGRGKGATFTVRLPLIASQVAVEAAPTTSKTTSSPATARPLRILLVEDHGDTARIMSRLLSAQGHDVQSAADVATATKLAHEQSFDLLLSDLGLPDGSGLDLMRALRAKGNTLPGIALSGYGQEKDIEASRAAGFIIHLVKPVNLSKLKDEIAKAVGDRMHIAGKA